MKRSTLIDLTLKIVGILQVIPLLNIIFRVIAFIPGLGMFLNSSSYSQISGFGITGIILTLLGTLIGPVIYIIVIQQLIFRSQYWTRKILKHEEYDEDIHIKIEPSVLLQLALITSALLLFFWNMPEVVSLSQQWFISKAVNSRDFIPNSFDASTMLEPTIKIITALITFTWSYPISKWLAKRIPGPEQTSATEDPIKE